LAKRAASTAATADAERQRVVGLGQMPTDCPALGAAAPKKQKWQGKERER